MNKATKSRLLSLITLITLAVGGWFTSAEAANRFVTIGTAGITGVYYPAGGAICRLVNRGRKEHGIRCSVESTGGSIYNINAIRKGELDLGVAQSDWQFHAYNGSDVFASEGPFPELRSLFSLHSEPFTVVARKDSGITTFDDLTGKRVNVGNPGSGHRSTMDAIMAKKGWDEKSFRLVSELKATEQGAALCDNKIDAFVYAVGHPNGSMQEVTTSCEVAIIPVVGKEVEELIAESPYYAKAVIPGGMYTGNPDAVETFGVKATFVSASTVDDELIYEVVKAIFENFDNFKTLHPVFSTLDPVSMITDGNTAPLHEGAIKYYKEKGMLKQ